MPATLATQFPPIVVKHTGQVSMECIAQGNPLPRVVWYEWNVRSNKTILLARTRRRLRAHKDVTRPRNGIEVVSSADRPDYTVTSSLVLTGISAAGIYVCEARNIGRYGRTQRSEVMKITESLLTAGNG